MNDSIEGQADLGPDDQTQSASGQRESRSVSGPSGQRRHNGMVDHVSCIMYPRVIWEIPRQPPNHDTRYNYIIINKQQQLTGRGIPRNRNQNQDLVRFPCIFYRLIVPPTFHPLYQQAINPSSVVSLPSSAWKWMRYHPPQ